MTITEKELQTLSHLAYLDCDNDNTHALVNEINAIIDFVEQLKTVDTKHVAPLFHPIDLHQHLRADAVTEDDCANQLAEIAPLFEEGLYWVPKVIDEGNK
ncbi:MAG: glutamyl-tRNA amidotransferase [Legionellales bacterium RIFCSPHIGHO2_12_FULL_42_9]|nr:MAG: glutamyl-tRNA amidotransferase [Legionellales bacterium RIFCSPHIGHO2_12_FULL_42_9]